MGHRSLGFGQIRLIWSKPTLTGPNSHLGGYGVVCSYTEVFPSDNPVDCSRLEISEDNGLVEAVLSDVDINKPVYASVSDS